VSYLYTEDKFNMGFPKVLIVEDDEHYNARYYKLLSKKATVLIASSLAQAGSMFNDNQDVALIIMDPCVRGGTPNTLKLTEAIREYFHGPMIAASGSPHFRRKLLDSGCDHEATKAEAARMAIKLLNKQKRTPKSEAKT
jgi:DNA-binding response OmpR family regulator